MRLEGGREQSGISKCILVLFGNLAFSYSMISGKFEKYIHPEDNFVRVLTEDTVLAYTVKLGSQVIMDLP